MPEPRWIFPNSSKILKYRHRPESNRIEIVFHSGVGWRYPCSADELREFESAGSLGSHHHHKWGKTGAGEPM